MIYFKNNDEIALIKKSSLLLAKTLGKIAPLVVPGTNLLEIDAIAEDFIRSNNGIPSFKGYNGFPNALCLSLNDVVVHGIPSSYELKDGDILSVDCGVILNGWFSDSAYTFAVGNVSEATKLLLERTKKSLQLGIDQAIAGNRTGDIGNAVQQYTESFGYGVVRELVGHGVGKQVHEKPEVPNYGKKGHGALLKEGMVIAIEPMINLGKAGIKQDRDGWTIRTTDNKVSAHFEHTVAIRKDKPEVLTTFEYIEETIKNG